MTVDVARRLAALSPDDRAALDALLEGVDARPKTFRAFTQTVTLPAYFRWHRHIQALATLLDAVAEGRIRRAMVFLPPQHGKSHTLSELGAAYYLRRHPDRFVAVASYSEEMALLRSRAARRYYGETGAAALDSRAVHHWETGQGGGMWAAGVGGSQTGKGYHFGIIDDPVKDYAEACSAAIRQRNEDWYDAVFSTRQRPDAAIVVICTRWHERDLAGWLLAREAVQAEGWTVLAYPALAEPGYDWRWPASCTVWPDWRTTPDEPLCEPIQGFAKLDAYRRGRPHFFAALYQQHPQPREGGLFQRAWFPIVTSAPPAGDTCRGWDKAATADAGDYTAGVKVRRAPDGRYYICDVVRGRWATGLRDRAIRRSAEADGYDVLQAGEQEPGSAGKDVALAFRRMLEGFRVRVAPATGDKSLRAEPLASAAQGGTVALVRGAWNEAFLDELVAFPTGAHDDQVDAAALAFNALARRSAPAVSPPLDLSSPSHWRLESDPHAED